MGREAPGGNVIERQILFSAAMVRAILQGKKQQTRRIVKGVDECPHGYDGVVKATVPQEAHLVGKHCFALASGESLYLRCPYGIAGERLWVRETWKPHPPGSGRTRPSLAIYRADYELSEGPGPWKPAIHMPRWACRLVLDLVAVRVERLQDISERDCIAEGIKPAAIEPAAIHYADGVRGGYAWLWDSLNAKRGHGWSTNPWVWVIEFRRGK